MALTVFVILTLCSAGMILLPRGTSKRPRQTARRGTGLRYGANDWRDYYPAPRTARAAEVAWLESAFAAPAAERSAGR